MKILIIGSEGFIGSHLVKFFVSCGNFVLGCDLFEVPQDIGYHYQKVSRLSPEWDEIFLSEKFDVCINAAGSGNVPYSMQHPLIDFESNTLDVIRILDAIRRHNRSCRYLHISSAAVYGNPEAIPVKEDAPTRPLSPYGWHKLMSELACLEYQTVFGLQILIIRPFSLYGEGLRKQLLWDICRRLKTADTIKLFGTGNESRDFLHVDDLTKLIDILISKVEFKGQTLNAGTGLETTINKVAQIFESCYPGKKILFSGERRAGDPTNWRADVAAITSLGFVPGIQLDSGIRKYSAWFDKHYQPG